MTPAGIARLISITQPNEIALSAWYQANPTEIAGLLLQVGRALANPTAPAVKRDPCHPALTEVLPVQPSNADWLTVNLTQLSFPAACCRCCAPADATVTWTISPRWAWLWYILSHTHSSLEVTLPVCQQCRANDRRRSLRATLVGAAVLSGFAAFIGVLSGQNIDAEFFGAIAGTVMVGCMIGHSVSKRVPMSVKNYSRTKGTVTLRFRNHAYTNLFLEHLANTHDTEFV